MIGENGPLAVASVAGFRGLLCGVAFGLASPLASHPFDTIKTRMQASPSCASGGSISALRSTIASGGIKALYAGLTPPLIGSVLYRSTQMGVFSYVMAYCHHNISWTRRQFPGTGGLEFRVIFAAAAATTARAIVETPLESIKVRMQCDAPLPNNMKELFRGFSLTWSRLFIALGSFFILCDSADRHAPSLFSTPVIGPFLKGGVAATAGWWLAWPLEVAKNRVQSGRYENARIALVSAIKEYGYRGLYRGLAPGSLRSLIGNGAAMASFDLCMSCTEKTNHF
jgi:solute carrier family 25 carnitine/acylcarnitine transporter 20/29